MGESDFDAIDEPIPRTLDNRKAIMKSRIEQQSVEAGHGEQTRRAEIREKVTRPSNLAVNTFLERAHQSHGIIIKFGGLSIVY